MAVLEATDHPNIARVFELMEDKQNFYFVMEYCAGGNLLEKVLKLNNLTEKVAVGIIE